MKQFAKILLTTIVTINISYADDMQIDQLLNIISAKDDLSAKTQIENGGISYIYTRDDIRRMQAHTLKDILKSTYPFGYDENNFGLADPYMMRTSAPFMSSNIRIYIDNQELSSGLYGSGIIIYGDMDIDFVDHIEVYSGNPTFQYSTEPAFTIVKLYSKSAQKDEGSKVAASYGTHGSTSLYGYNSKELENDWSYFSYISNNNDNREKYHNNGATLSRDKDTSHFFGSFYNKNNRIIIDAIDQQRDSFISNSVFATPETSYIDSKYIHIGYDGDYGDLSYSLTYDNHFATSNYVDKYAEEIKAINASSSDYYVYSIYSDFDAKTYTAGLKYNIKTTNNDTLIGGTHRVKDYTFNKVLINDNLLPQTLNDNQTISTLFVENQYKISNNKILTTGGAFTKVTNNHSIQDDDLVSYRLGYTYVKKQLVSKTIVSHIESTLDPYLVESITFLEDYTKKIAPTKQNIFMQNIKYTKGTSQYEMVLSCIVLQNQLVSNEDDKLYPYEKDIGVHSILGRYTLDYNTFDKIEVTLGANHMNNVPRLDLLHQYSATFKGFNKYKQFDFFNEILCYTDDYIKKTFYDFSCGVIYQKTDDLSFSLKGTNLFNKAKETSYSRVSLTTLEQLDPLSISPVDRTVTISMEYTF